MNGIFKFYNKLSKTQQKYLYKIYNSCKLTPETIHNLSNITHIPESVKLCLVLGYKYNFSSKPNFKEIEKSILEGMRKISWHIFFKNKENDNNFDKIAQITHKIKKVVQPNKKSCPIESVLFSNNFLRKSMQFIKTKVNPHNKVHDYLIEETLFFIKDNNLIIVPSDKNAGLCVLNVIDYNNEIKRQLNDTSTYRLSVKAELDYKLADFQDKACYLGNILQQKIKMKTLIPPSFQAASFYVLPKVHKHFEKLPVGRPICNTRKTINKGVSMLLDSILQPLSMYIPDLLIDSTHLIYLLSLVKLNPIRKYVLVTADISSMYLELPIDCCKREVIKFFNDINQPSVPPFKITSQQLKSLLDLSLDYNFIQFEEELYFQFKGIQMGNSASVSVANITAALQLLNIWKDEMIFKKRFIDDIFLILDVTDFSTDVKNYLENTFTHPFLKFSFEFSCNQVNFLDLNIMINDKNEITTSLYKKSMNKHEFLHFTSIHPSHNKMALPYSCGLRVIRSCSDENVRNKELNDLFDRFVRRGYPETVLNKSRNKLLTISREDLITPKSNLLLNYLRIHNNIPSNLISENPKHFKVINKNNIYVTFPFYENIKNYKKIVNNIFIKELSACNTACFRNCVLDLNVNVAFSINNSLSCNLKKQTL